jgi:hypothetical protein
VKQGSTEADVKKAMAAAINARNNFLEGHDMPSDRNILGTMLYMYYKDVPKEQHPIGFFESIKGSFGDLNDEATFKNTPTMYLQKQCFWTTTNGNSL